MKNASPQLIALLATRQFYSADLYQFSLLGGGTLRYCSGDKDLIWNGFTWSAGGSTGPYFDRKDNKAKCHWKIGVEVDKLTFDVIPKAATVEGEPLLSAVRQGVFDGAELTLYRAFMPTYGNTAAGTVIMFVGRVAEVDAGRSLATFVVNSHLELLNQNLPRNLYQSGCVNALYDASCTLSRAAFGVSGTAISSSTPTLIRSNSFVQPANYFDMGQISFTSGVLAGISRTIKVYGYITGLQTVTMSAPFPAAPAAGDAFTLYPGCDKSQATCVSKFNNLKNFRGFPNIPTPETAI